MGWIGQGGQIRLQSTYLDSTRLKGPTVSQAQSGLSPSGYSIENPKKETWLRRNWAFVAIVIVAVAIFALALGSFGNDTSCFGPCGRFQPNPVVQILGSGAVGQNAYLEVLNVGNVGISSVSFTQSGSSGTLSCMGCSPMLAQASERFLNVTIDPLGNHTLWIAIKSVLTAGGIGESSFPIDIHSLTLMAFPFGNISQSSGSSPAQILVVYQNTNTSTVASLRIVLGQFANGTYVANVTPIGGIFPGKDFTFVTTSAPCPTTTSLCMGATGLQLRHGYTLTVRVFGLDFKGSVVSSLWTNTSTGPAD